MEDYLDGLQKRCILGVGGHTFFVSTKKGFLVIIFTFHFIKGNHTYIFCINKNRLLGILGLSKRCTKKVHSWCGWAGGHIFCINRIDFLVSVFTFNLVNNYHMNIHFCINKKRLLGICIHIPLDKLNHKPY